MSQSVRKAGMKEGALEFIRKVFTKGAEYIDDVDISGLYPELLVESNLVIINVLNLQS